MEGDATLERSTSCQSPASQACRGEGTEANSGGQEEEAQAMPPRI